MTTEVRAICFSVSMAIDTCRNVCGFSRFFRVVGTCISTNEAGGIESNNRDHVSSLIFAGIERKMGCLDSRKSCLG